MDMYNDLMKQVAVSIILFIGGGFGTYGQQQIPNSGFEEWESIRQDVSEPTHWNSIKNTDGSNLMKNQAPEVWFRAENAHSGKYALKLENKTKFGIVANGLITNGAIHGAKDKTKTYIYPDLGKADFSTPFTSRPVSLSGWYMYDPAGNDSAMVVVLLHDGKITLPDKGTKDKWVGGVKLMLPSTGNKGWTKFSVPIEYFKGSKPKYILVILSAGNRMKAVNGSVAYFDDLKLEY